MATNQQNVNTIINDGLTKNIIATILNLIATCVCCLGSLAGFIAGLFGIYFSTTVKNKLALGDTVGAQQAASTANLVGNISLIILAVSIIAGIIMTVFFAGAMALEEFILY